MLVGIAAMSAAFVETLIPLQIGNLTDKILPLKDKNLLTSKFLILIGLALIDFVANFLMRYWVVRFSAKVIFDLRQDIFTALQDQELDFYSKENVGQIMARSIEEIYSLRDLLTWGLRITFLIIFLFITAIVSMFSVSIELSFIFLIMPIIIVVLITRFAVKNKQVFYDVRYKFGVLSDTLAQNLQGIQTVKSLGREREQLEIFNVKNQEYFNGSMKTAKIRATIIPGMVFVISIALILLIFIGGTFLTLGRITIGDFIAFMLLSLNLAVPGRFVGWIGIVAQDANSAAIRLGEIFDAPKSIQNMPSAPNNEVRHGDLAFEGVSFGYPGENHILCDINLKIPHGQKIAILGATGSGKSTLINLIPRFYDPTHGHILIDGKDIRMDYTLKSLRKNIGIVHQESFLFTLTLHDNIAFGKPKATRDDVIKAAKAAQIHEFISGLEEGYDTIVGERGVTLSGGQRQRVTIARTVLSDPKILIFDDSVSAVDPETESKIQESLDNANFTGTTIVISQRPSSLKYVERIVVLEKGRIVQDGNHSELFKEEGMYRNFINTIRSQVKFMDWDQQESVIKEGNL